MTELGYLDFCPANMSIQSSFNLKDGIKTYETNDALNALIYSVVLFFILTYVFKFYRKKDMQIAQQNTITEIDDIDISAIERVIYKPQISRSCVPVITT